MSSFLVAADIGGTFTDLIVQTPDGRLIAHKVLSTPDDYSTAIGVGVGSLLDELGLDAAAVREICHGTTIGTNAVLERKGARTGLITTKGFRDVLEIRRIRFPEPFNVQWEKPDPLVPRELRLELAERIGSTGEVVLAPDAAEARALVDSLRAEGVESLAIALINSYANPDHEEWLAEQIARLWPECQVTVSSRILPEMGEYERTSTAVANAYLAPIMERYLTRLRERLDSLRLGGPVFVAQSNGGLFLHSFAIRKPFLTLESGPAAGFVAAQHLARTCGYDQLLAVDMGGTTTKASFLADGNVSWASEFEIGSGMSQASRLLNGGGYAIRCSIIDLAEVGAGGGSIAWVDVAGLLHVGPESAGANPGPACYGQGGEEATLTDANLVLGYINPHALAGGSFAIDPGRAHAAVEKLAERLGKAVVDTAHGIHLIANSNMMYAIRAVSTQRGRDVRHVDMLAFGGGGPLQAVGLAGSLGLRRVIVPPFPGLFSSLGLLIADIEHHLMHGFVAGLGSIDTAALNARLAAMEEEVRAELASAGYTTQVEIHRSAALKLAHRSGEVLLDLPDGPLGSPEIAGLDERFKAAYRAVYRHLPADAGTELLNLRVVGRVRRDTDPGHVFGAALVADRARVGGSRRAYFGPDLGAALVADRARVGGSRRAYFGPDLGYHEVPVLGREDLTAEPRPGPLLIEEPDSTTVVHPGWKARLDAHGNVVVER